MTNERQVNGLTFRQWIDRVDEVLIRESGFSSKDLVGFLYYDSWKTGGNPEVIAEWILENYGTSSDMG